LLINVTDMNLWLATAMPTALASVMSYFLNKHFTFKNTEKGWKPVLRFAVNIAACYLLAYGIAIPLMEWALSGASAVLRDNVTKVTGMCLFTGFNYLGQRLFAFRDKTGESQ
jgi:putative flippase GtrA